MKKVITGIISLTMIFSLLVGCETQNKSQPQDSSQAVDGAAFAEAIKLSINESGETVITPDSDSESLTYEEAASILEEMLHLTDQEESYKDVPDGSKFAGAIGAIEKIGITFSDDEETFGYGNYVTEDKMSNIADKVKKYISDKHKNYTKFTAASLQFNPEMYQLDENSGVKLVVAPEMSTTGYSYSSLKEIEPYLDTIPGKATDIMAQLTKKYNAYIVFGLAEKDEETGMCYNAAALVGPEGYIGKYRKTHQWETEEHWSSWGDLGVPVYATDIGNIAINICMDAAYYESARLAAVNGADIIAFPTNSSAQAVAALPARAMQNGLYFISANRSNTELGFHMIGASAAWTPLGDKLYEAPLIATSEDDVNETTSYSAEIDPALFTNDNKNRLFNRQTDAYTQITLKVAPWDYSQSSESAHVKAVALQYEPSNNIDDNKKKIKDLMKNVKDVNLVVLPELSLTGIVESDVHANSEEAVKFAGEIAKEYKTAVIVGAVEQVDDKLYNASILVDKKGTTVGTYHKVHLNDSEKAWATPGDSFDVYTIEGIGKIGMLVGDDVCYPEAAGCLSVQRADIIAIPSAWYGQFGGYMQTTKDMSANKFPDNAMVLWDAVSEGAEAYTITANYVGTDKNYLGASALNTLDPLYALDQPISASTTEETAFEMEFDTIRSDGWYNQNMLINSRRTDVYKNLVK